MQGTKVAKRQELIGEQSKRLLSHFLLPCDDAMILGLSKVVLIVQKEMCRFGWLTPWMCLVSKRVAQNFNERRERKMGLEKNMERSYPSHTGLRHEEIYTKARCNESDPMSSMGQLPSCKGGLDWSEDEANHGLSTPTI